MSESTEKKHVNIFKFGLYRIDRNTENTSSEPIMERIFSADSYNPVVRYSVDIREKISGIISKLDKILSRKNLSYNIQGYNNLVWYNNQLNLDRSKKYKQPNKLQQPDPVKYFKGSQEFYGALFRIGLYINNHPIVERDFGVSDYNPSSRFSKELVELFDGIVKDIQTHLYNVDIEHMWDDYTIIKVYGLNIGQIRELNEKRQKDSPRDKTPKEDKRRLLLKNIGNFNFVKKIKIEYGVNNSNEIEEEVD